MLIVIIIGPNYISGKLLKNLAGLLDNRNQRAILNGQNFIQAEVDVEVP